MSEFSNFTEKDYQSYINLLRLALDAVLDAETLEDAKRKAQRAAVGEIHAAYGEFEVVQLRQHITDLETQLAKLSYFTDTHAKGRLGRWLTAEEMIHEWKSRVENFDNETETLEAQLAEAQRREGLLRAVAEAARQMPGEASQDDVEGSAYCVIHSDYLLNVHGFLQAAIDGGALET